MSAAGMPVNTAAGVAYNVLASFLFAVLYAYATLLEPLGGEAIYGWRILLTMPFLTVLIIARGDWHEVTGMLRRIRRERFFWAQRLLSSMLLGGQVWLFMWAPINGYGLDVSLGYFLLPISMVIVGRVAFGDRMSIYQLGACVLALLGIASQVVRTDSISWPALAVCLGYPWYFWLRRATNANNLGALWVDMSLALPVGLFFIAQGGQVFGADAGALPWLVLGLGVISASALGFQALSAPRLNLTLFGLLIYVEPVLLVVASLLLGETIAPEQWPTYLAIWGAVLLLVAEGMLALRKKGQNAASV